MLKYHQHSKKSFCHFDSHKSKYFTTNKLSWRNQKSNINSSGITKQNMYLKVSHNQKSNKMKIGSKKKEEKGLYIQPWQSNHPFSFECFKKCTKWYLGIYDHSHQPFEINSIKNLLLKEYDSKSSDINGITILDQIISNDKVTTSSRMSPAKEIQKDSPIENSESKLRKSELVHPIHRHRNESFFSEFDHSLKGLNVFVEFDLTKIPKRLKWISEIGQDLVDSQISFYLNGVMHGKKIFAEDLRYSLFGKKIIKSIQFHVIDFREGLANGKQISQSLNEKKTKHETVQHFGNRTEVLLGRDAYYSDKGISNEKDFLYSKILNVPQKFGLRVQYYSLKKIEGMLTNFNQLVLSNGKIQSFCFEFCIPESKFVRRTQEKEEKEEKDKEVITEEQKDFHIQTIQNQNNSPKKGKKWIQNLEKMMEEFSIMAQSREEQNSFDEIRNENISSFDLKTLTNNTFSSIARTPMKITSPEFFPKKERAKMDSITQNEKVKQIYPYLGITFSDCKLQNFPKKTNKEELRHPIKNLQNDALFAAQEISPIKDQMEPKVENEANDLKSDLLSIQTETKIPLQILESEKKSSCDCSSLSIQEDLKSLTLDFNNAQTDEFQLKEKENLNSSVEIIDEKETPKENHDPMKKNDTKSLHSEIHAKDIVISNNINLQTPQIHPSLTMESMRSNFNSIQPVHYNNPLNIRNNYDQFPLNQISSDNKYVPNYLNQAQLMQPPYNFQSNNYSNFNSVNIYQYPQMMNHNTQSHFPQYMYQSNIVSQQNHENRPYQALPQNNFELTGWRNYSKPNSGISQIGHPLHDSTFIGNQNSLMNDTRRVFQNGNKTFEFSKGIKSIELFKKLHQMEFPGRKKSNFTIFEKFLVSSTPQIECIQNFKMMDFWKNFFQPSCFGVKLEIQSSNKPIHAFYWPSLSSIKIIFRNKDQKENNNNNNNDDLLISINESNLKTPNLNDINSTASNSEITSRKSSKNSSLSETDDKNSTQNFVTSSEVELPHLRLPLFNKIQEIAESQPNILTESVSNIDQKSSWFSILWTPIKTTSTFQLKTSFLVFYQFPNLREGDSTNQSLKIIGLLPYKINEHSFWHYSWEELSSFRSQELMCYLQNSLECFMNIQNGAANCSDYCFMSQFL